MSGARRAVRVSLQIVVIGGIFAFLFFTLGTNIRELSEYEFRIDAPRFLAATAFLIAGNLGWYALWHLLTVRLGIALPAKRAAVAYYFSQMGKYVPGKVWAFAARFYLYQRAGHAKAVVWVAVVLDGFFQFAGFLIILAAAAPFASFPISQAARIAAPIALVIGLAGLHPRVAETVLNRFLVWRGKEPIRVRLSFAELLGFVVLNLLQLLLLCCALFFLVDAFHPIEPARFFDLCLAFSLTALLSAAAVFAPVGLGVREVTYYAVLRTMVPDAFAVVISLFCRVWVTVAEWMFIGAAALASRFGGPDLELPKKDEIDRMAQGTL